MLLWILFTAADLTPTEVTQVTTPESECES